VIIRGETQRIREFLADRRLLWWVVGLAIVLGLPTLGVGLIGDDLPHYAFLRAQHHGQSDAPWWNMFALVEGPRERTLGMRTAGRYPWWVDPDLRVVFFRPVAVATHHVDHWLWPNAYWLMHLHSVLWHALVCALAWMLARRWCSSPTAAGLATLVYAVSFSHLIPVAWLAHRNGLVSTALALACLLAHDEWRRGQSKLAAVAAPLLLASSLLAAEAGVVTFAFLLMYALVFDRGRRGALALLPYVGVIVIWHVTYVAMGFGAIGSGAYLDPFGDPLGFLAELPSRFAWLLGMSVSPPLMDGFPPWLWWPLTLAVGALALVFALRSRSRAARFGAASTVLGLIPLTASLPGDRLLILTSFAMALVFGELLSAWLLDESSTIPRRTGGLLVLVVHLLVPAIAGVVLGSKLGQRDATHGSALAYGAELPNEGLARKGLVIVHAPNHIIVTYLPAVRVARGLAAPNFSWLLHEGPDAPELRRIDAQTLELHAPHGWPSTPLSAYWRSPSRSPFSIGDTIKTVDYEATIKQVERGRAKVVEFRFRAPLEHPSLDWATWTGSEFERVDPRRWTLSGL
jgi:hypothetical protein